MMTTRRAFTIVEVLVALAILTAFLIPVLEMLRPSTLAVPATASVADGLIGSIATTLTDMGSEPLQNLMDKGESIVYEYRKVPLSAFPFRSTRSLEGSEKAGLDPHVYLRLNRNIDGQFGLDRLDVKMSYKMSGKARWISRTIVKRNHPQLVALSQIRMHGAVERLSPEEFRDSMSYAVIEHTTYGQSGRLAGSPFPVPIYPRFLAAFEGKVKDQAVLDERRSRMEGFGESLGASGAYLAAVEDAKPPRFPRNDSICN